MTRSKVSMIPNPVPVAKATIRQRFAHAVASRGVEQDKRAKRNRTYARHEPRPEVRASLNDLADCHERSADRAAKSRWVVG